MPMRNQAYKFLQLSQTSRPIQGYNMYLESSTPRDRFLHQFRNPEPIQFAEPSPANSMSPKPWTPENRYQYQFYDSGLMQIPQSPRPIGTYNMSYTCHMPQERYPHQYTGLGHVPTTTPMTTEEGSEAVDDITKGNMELYNRLPASLSHLSNQNVPMRNQGYKLHQLSQPSRPIQGYNMYFESSTPRDRLLHQYRNQELIQFAQPTSPVKSISPKLWTPENTYQYQFSNSGLMQIPQSPRPVNSMSPKPCTPENRYQYQFYDSGLMQSPQSPRPIGTDNMSYTHHMPQERYAYQYSDQGHIPTTMPMTTEEGSEAVDDITEGNSELYSRLPASLSQLNLYRINNKLTTTMEGGLIQHSTRGLHGQAEELSHKLERFKIRTIDLGGVVNADKERR